MTPPSYFLRSIPQFHTDPLNSTHRFHTRTTPFQHTKSLSSTTKTPQFNTPLSYFLSEGCVELRGFWCETKGVLNWGVFNVELTGCVELSGFWCGTEGCVELRGLLNWGIFGVELRDFGGWKGVARLCGTNVLNWGGCGTKGDPFLR